jgi:acyl-CoA thioesterase-1
MFARGRALLVEAPGPRAVALLSCALAAGCGSSHPPASRSGADETARAPVTARPRIVCLGDSLTAGYGLDDPSTQSYPALLQAKLDAAGLAFEVVNAGVSGDTSAGGLRRLDWSLEGDVRVLVVALGANDGLRGQSVAEMKRNLDQVVGRARGRGIVVLLAGMEVPTNLGPAYAEDFRRAFRDVARAHGVALLPFLLSGVAGDPKLNQGDSIHPNALGTRLVAENVWTALKPLLDAAAGGRAGSAGSPRKSP